MDWNARYHQGDTPWEKGEPHPGLPFLVEEHRELLAGASEVLVPGSGIGHDAAFLARSVTAQVTGLDLAEEAVRRANEKHREESLTFREGDLFAWQGSYDLVFEHTCFCAIPVERRPDYVEAMARLIPTGGHLLGVFFLKPDHEGEDGPPFGVCVAELEEFFGRFFELSWSRPPAATYPGRVGEGRELTMLWRRR